jgi:hypothetical protein
LRGKAIVRRLRDAVFRDSHLYEPPGNVFVTVGITATFLGLAFGLLSLDLPGILASVSADGSPPGDKGQKFVAAITAFTGCMGLALGVSMLGVLTSMAAQWLRGFGPAQSIDDLLARADAAIAPHVAAASADPPDGQEES